MSNQNNLFPLLILIIISISSTKLVSSAPDQIHFTGGNCSTSDNVTANGLFANNTLSLLSTLSTRALSSRYFNLSVGFGLDQVNGLYLCRPDISLETCQECVSDSALTFLTRCPNKKQGILWQQECMLRYTNRTIFATEEVTPWTFNWSVFNVSDREVFPSLLNRTMQKLIAQASLPSETQRFKLGQANYTAFETLYAMVLCNPDITGLECWDCLKTAFARIPTCCAGGLAQWTMIVQPSCQLRYDTAQFIFPWTSESSLPAPAPSPTSTD